MVVWNLKFWLWRTEVAIEQPLKGLQNLRICSVLRSFKQGLFFSCYTCCDKGPRVFRFHLRNPLMQSPWTTHKGMWGIYSNLDSHESPFSRLLRHRRWCGGPILTSRVPNVFISKKKIISMIWSSWICMEMWLT
jgi:hypothetical protein